MRLCFWLHCINDCLKKNHELAKWAKDNGYEGIKYFGVVFKIVSEQMRTFAPGKRMESISFVLLNQSI